MRPAVGVLLLLASFEFTSPPRRGAETIVVHPGNMRRWQFFDGRTQASCAAPAYCAMVAGPNATPSGTGSAELATANAGESRSLVNDGYRGLALSRITRLDYWALRQSGTTGTISIHLDADMDVTDADSSGVRIDYLPDDSSATNGTWRHLDAMRGAYWSSSSTTVISNNVHVTNACVRMTPCTWSRLQELFPRIGVSSNGGRIHLTAAPAVAGFHGNVDAFSIAIDRVVTTYDFELDGGPPVPALPPDTIPDFPDHSLAVSGGNHIAGKILPDIVIVVFTATATQQQRQAAIDAVGGTVIGGRRQPNGDGQYIVRIDCGGSIEPLFAAIGRLRQLPQVLIATPNFIVDLAPT